MNRFVYLAALSILIVAVPSLSVSQDPALPAHETFTTEEVLNIIEQVKYGTMKFPQCANQLDSKNGRSDLSKITPSQDKKPCAKASDPRFICNRTHYRRKQMWPTASEQCAFWSSSCGTTEPLCVYAGSQSESELKEDSPIECKCIQNPT